MGNHSVQHYKDAAQQLPVDMLKEDFSANGLTETEVKEIHTKALFKENSELLGMASGSVEGINKRGAAAQAEKHKSEQQRRRKQKETTDTIAYLLGQIGALEAGIAAQHGENFAEDLFSELHEDGLIEPGRYQEIMAIEDQTERRHAIAVEIQAGLDAGTISQDDLQDHEWSGKWLKLHDQAQDKKAYGAQQGISGEKAASELTTNSLHEAGSIAFNEQHSLTEKFQPLAIGTEQSEETELDFDSLGSNFDKDMNLGSSIG